MNSQLSGNSLEFLRIFGNGKLGLTLGLEFLGIPRNFKFYNVRSLRIVENFWEYKNSGQLGLEFLGILSYAN